MARELLRSYPEIERVRKAKRNREKAQCEWRDAILCAHTAGLSLRVIGEAAGVSHVYVLQVTREA